MFPIFLAIAAVIGAIFQYLESVENERKAEENQHKAEVATQKLIKAQGILVKSQNKTYEKTLELADANKQNLELSKELNKLQNHTLKIALGDGFLEVDVLPTTRNELQFLLKNASDYPSYDIYAGVYDFDEIVKCKTLKKDSKIFIDKNCFESHKVAEVSISNLASGANGTIPNIITLKNKLSHFYIVIHSRNAIYMYRFVIENLGGGNLNGKWILNHRLKNQDQMIKIKEGGTMNLPEGYWEHHFLGDGNWIVTEL